MIDPQSNHQPVRLTPEEELDVLEAVYKKDPRILRPDQMHKLIESGRVPNFSYNDYSDTSTSNPQEILDNEVAQRAYRIVDDIVCEMDKYRSHICAEDDWNEMDEMQKYDVRDQMFESVFGITSEDLGYMIYKQLKAGE